MDAAHLWWLHPRVKFPDSFSLSTNEKHSSNTQESLKFIEEIILSYFEIERDILNLGEDFPVLLVIDFFSDHMSDPVIKMQR